MSDIKCPFCQQELKPQTMDGEWLECWNCSYHEPSHHPFPQRILCGTKELWQELIRTRKALDVAVDALKEITNNDRTRKEERRTTFNSVRKTITVGYSI